MLGRIAEMVDAEGSRVTVVIPINGRELPDEKDLQAEEIRRQIAGHAHLGHQRNGFKY